MAILSALAIMMLGCGDLPSPSGQSQSGYYIELPAEAGSPGDDPNGGATIRMTTNLPAGILVRIEWEQPGPPESGSMGSSCCPAFGDGSLESHVSGGDCYTPDSASKGFVFKVTAAPHPDMLAGARRCSFGGCPTPLAQPQNVQDELGPDFEKLEGEQVTTVDGQRALVATKEYAWPSDACAPTMAYLMPDKCPESTISILDDTGGEGTEGVGGSVVSTLSQYRLCDLYNYATTDFQRENPWLEFRDRTRAWIDAHRPLMGPGFEFYMTHKIVKMSDHRLGGEFNSPSWIEVDYTLRGERVAHARFVARLWYSGYTKWDMAELVLY